MGFAQDQARKIRDAYANGDVDKARKETADYLTRPGATAQDRKLFLDQAEDVNKLRRR